MRAWTGLLMGFVAWYAAHEIGIFFSDYNCRHPWILPLAQVLAFGFALAGALFSWRERKISPFGSMVGTSAGALFSLVILWQAIGSFIFTGCER